MGLSLSLWSEIFFHYQNQQMYALDLLFFCLVLLIKTKVSAESLKIVERPQNYYKKNHLFFKNNSKPFYFKIRIEAFYMVQIRLRSEICLPIMRELVPHYLQDAGKVCFWNVFFCSCAKLFSFLFIQTCVLLLLLYVIFLGAN